MDHYQLELLTQVRCFHDPLSYNSHHNNNINHHYNDRTNHGHSLSSEVPKEVSSKTNKRIVRGRMNRVQSQHHLNANTENITATDLENWRPKPRSGTLNVKALS